MDSKHDSLIKQERYTELMDQDQASRPWRVKRSYFVSMTMFVMLLGVAIWAVSTMSSSAPTYHDDRIFIRSNQKYTDFESNVQHPAVTRAGDERFILTVMGAGTTTDENELSIACYMEPEKSRDEFVDYRGYSAAELRAMAAEYPPQPKKSAGVASKFAIAPFMSAMTRVNVDRALVVSPTKPVPARQVATIFKDGFKNQVSLSDKLSQQQQNLLVEQFDQLIDKPIADGVETYQPGDVLAFAVTDNDFSLTLNEQPIGEIKDNSEFNQAVWGTFTGENSDVRDAFVDRAPLLWMHGDLKIDLNETGGQAAGGESDHPVGLSLKVWDKSTAQYTGETSIRETGAWWQPSFVASIGLFVDTKKFDALPERLQDPAALLPELLAKEDVLKGFRFQFSRSGPVANILDPLNEAMLPILQAHFGGDEQKVTEARDAFNLMFPSEFQKDDTFYLMCDPENRLVGVYNDVNWRLETNDSPALCGAFFSAYLGDDSLLQTENRDELVAHWVANPTMGGDNVQPEPTPEPTPTPEPEPADDGIPKDTYPIDIPEGRLGSDGNIVAGYAGVAAAASAVGLLVISVAKSGKGAANAGANPFKDARGEYKALEGKEGAAAPMAETPAEAPEPTGTFGKLKAKLWNDKTQLLAYVAIWYLGNIYYNIWNKKACIALGKNALGATNAHWALSAMQLLVGVLFVAPMWATGIRKKPQLKFENWKALAPVGLFASLAHAFSVLAMGAGAVSFAQIVKSGEPVFAAATSAILLRDISHPLVYLALVPIIGGVGLASLGEMSFTWTALIAAALANQAAAFKNVVSKGVMGKDWAKNLGPQNTYAVITILALICTLPFVAFFDLSTAGAVYQQVLSMGTGGDVVKYSLLSGVMFYLYNEASFLALSKLTPVTHSVGNTLKRVVIIISSCIVFKTPMTLMGGIGSGVAVAGTLLYSLASKRFAKKKPAEPKPADLPKPAVA